MQRVLAVGVLAVLVIAGCASSAGGDKRNADSAISETLLTVFDSKDPRSVAESRGVQTSRHGVRVDVQTQGLATEDRGRFDLPGVHVHHFSAKYERVAVSVKGADALRALAEIDVVRRLAPAYGAVQSSGSSGGAQ